jgi:antirestriction protein
MERQPHQPNGGEQKPGVNSYGTEDPTEQARIERARQEASEQRQRDREEWERYVAAGINEEDAESLVEFQHYVRKQGAEAAQQQAEQHTEDSPAERKIRAGLYQARSEGRIVDDATVRRIAAELSGEEGSALDGLASSGAIQRDRMLQELAGYSTEGSWRVHWIDALTQYVLDRGERSALPDWADLSADEPESDSREPHVKTTDAHAERTASVERAPRTAPRIYVACLASYNEGIHHGLWIDANQDVHELQADVAVMLASSPIVGAEEYVIYDHLGFRGFEVGEHEDLAVVSRVAHGIARHGEAFAAYMSWAGSSEAAVERFHDQYIGTFVSPKEWARQIGQDLQWEEQLERRLDAELLPYVSIDYDAFASHLADDWQVIEGDDGAHVFAP